MDRETRDRRDRLLEDATFRPDARLELAELYRSLGHIDQAGRWGISVEGWARGRERDAYAALIKQRRPDAESMLRRLSGIGPREPLTDDARSIIEQAAVGATQGRALSGWRGQLDVVSRFTAVVVAGGGGIVAVIMVVMVFGAAFAGNDDLRTPARLAVTLGALSFGLAATFGLPSTVLRRQWVRTGLLVIAVIALGTVFAVLAPSPGFVLPGEA